jgi:serine/threonine protein phosphatase PrpC
VARAVIELLEQSHLLRPEALPAAADEAARTAGALGCRIYLISRDQRCLVPLDGNATGTPATADDEPLSVEGTLAGRAYIDTETMTASDGGRLWLPLLDGTERLGVLEVLVDPDQSDGLRGTYAPLAALVAELVVSKGQYTDTFERARRALPMGVPAEMLWRQLPPLTFAADRFVVAAQLEPWNEVGGDAFDYSIDRDLLRLAIFDAMGHGLGATLLAGVALAAYRNARRDGQGLVETAQTIDQTLSRQFGDESFVTGVLAELDLTNGTLCTLVAAHPAPLLVRAGRSLGELQTEPGFPLGFGQRDDTVVRVSLEPGDRVVMFSDGVVEARANDGAFFGTDRLVDLLVRQEARRQTPPETLRRLVLAVLEHQGGMLQDDATLVMLEWAGDSSAVIPTSDAVSGGRSG